MTRQRGFALISAIFILVVLAALGAFIVSVSTSQQVGAALDVQGVRAYQAARSGIEWGLYQVMQDPNFPNNTDTQNTNQLSASSGCTSVSSAAPTVTSFVPAAGALNAFHITVQCFAAHNSGPWVYAITATACNQPKAGWSVTTTACPNDAPGANYVERQLAVTF